MSSFVSAKVVEWTGVRALSFAPFLPEVRFGRLARDFPSQGFQWTSKVGDVNSKGYASHNLNLICDSQLVAENTVHLTDEWKALLTWINGHSYRSAMGASFGINLDASPLELRAVRHGGGGWIDPHTDRLDKLLTQLIYFNEDWRENWGGSLLLLGSNQVSDMKCRYVPVPNHSIAFQPSAKSWHAVEPVESCAGRERLSLLLHFSVQEDV